MPFVPADGTAEVVINYKFDTVDCVTVLHIHDDQEQVDMDPSYLSGLGTDVWNQWRDHVMPWLSANVQMISVVCTDLSEPDGQHGGFVGAPVLGGQAGQSLPANVSLVVAKQTARSGRNSQGRMLLPGVTEGNWPGGAGSSLPSTFVGNVNAALANVLTGVEDGGRVPGDANRHLVVLSKFDGTALVEQPNGEVLRRPVPRAAATHERVFALQLRPIVGTIRRRLHR